MGEGPHQNLQEAHLAGTFAALAMFVPSCSTGPWHGEPRHPTRQPNSGQWLRLSTTCNKHSEKTADASSLMQEL